MKTYKELLAEREALDQQISAARKTEIADAISQIRNLIADHGLTEEDIFPTRRRAGSVKTGQSIVAPKYRDPATGATWTGRGKPPAWIRDQDREQFLIPLAA